MSLDKFLMRTHANVRMSRQGFIVHCINNFIEHVHSTVRPAIFMYLNLCRNIIYHCECKLINNSIHVNSSKNLIDKRYILIYSRGNWPT